MLTGYSEDTSYYAHNRAWDELIEEAIPIAIRADYENDEWIIVNSNECETDGKDLRWHDFIVDVMSEKEAVKAGLVPA